jgi:hypothetical protein
MVGLGTLQDSPVNSLQPKLVDAVHLRWAFRPELGFPWHGFYLFRRNSKQGKGQCLSRRVESLDPGPMSVTAWTSGIGSVSSDRLLVLRDDFPPSNRVEFDLDSREYLEFLPHQLAHAVDIQIGFRKGDAKHSRCLPFTEMRAEALPNPYARLGVLLETYDRKKKSNPGNQVVQIKVGGVSTSAFLLVANATVKTEENIRAMEIKLVGSKKVRIQSTDSAGNKVLGKLISNPNDPIQVYRLEGEKLQGTSISVEEESYLISICIEGKELDQYVEIPVTAYLNGFEVDRVVLTGIQGDLASASLKSDAIDRIRISGGLASLIDLCWSSVFQDAQAGWKPLEEVKQPITLPVLHSDYPACNNLPTNFPVSRTNALARVKYGDPTLWNTPFADLHEQCLNLVKGGPAIPMADPSRAVSFPVETETGDTSPPPTIPRQHPLQLLLLAAMHAPIAHILGLYWSDTTAVPGETYDYLIVADQQGRAGHQVQKVLSQIVSEGFINLNGYIVFSKRVEPPAPLEMPTDARGYALPGATRPNLSGGVIDASCNAGLRWHLSVVNNVLLPESPVLYHLWRVGYGPSEPISPADITKFDPLTKENPLLVVENLLSISGVQRPPDWPPFPLYGFDNAVAEGWYGYRVSNVDIFGRHSALGPDARWFEWAPTPAPTPWYYVDPPGDKSVHPFAIGLLDKVPPPPPTGTEAFALDPEDPFVQRDVAYNTWFDTLSASEKTSVVGLRVCWNWTEAHMRQAPDTKEFRIYYQGGRLNTLLGQTTVVTAVSATESFIQTDIPNANADGTFINCSLKIGPDMFTVVGSNAGSPLRLRVKNIGPLKDVAPSVKVNCEINIPNIHALFVNYGAAHTWEERYYVVNYNDHVTAGVDEAGRPFRRYAVILPADSDTFRSGLPIHPDLSEPVKFAAIGVTAADSRTHTADDPKWGLGRWGGRTGNEGSMSPPVIVFRVLREKPIPPVPPPDADKVFATPADYHAASFYTFRWVPQPHLKTHVYRAMDNTVFNVDWSYQPRVAIAVGDLSLFPSATVEPRWNSAKRQQVATELNVLNAFPKTSEGKEQARKYYRGLSNDALRVLANLPNNETAFAQATVLSLDPNDPATANRIGPDNPKDYIVDPALRIYLDTLDGRSTNRYFYKACYVDGAQNRSVLSQSGPPIWLPNVVPPKSPTFTKFLAGDASPTDPGDNKITVRWASNRETDLAEYRIYRTMSEAEARSVRSMTVVHTVAVSAGEPSDRPAENVWTDTGIPALQWIYYRMTAVDSAGNESPPNDVVKARAFDESLPEVPALTVAWLPVPTNNARAQWTATTEVRLERRAAIELIWENVTDWLPAGTHSLDNSIDEHFPWKFRLRARKSTGAIATGSVVNLPRK